MISESTGTSKKAPGLASKTIILTVVIGIIVAAVLGGVLYLFLQYQQSQAFVNDPQKAQAQQSQTIVAEVSKLIVLPENEQPQVATVSDVNKLKSQSFFSQAKNGDIVLIYTQAQKAVLYDPIQKKIVEVGPINVSVSSPTGNPTPIELRVALFNGTSVTGLSSTTERDLKAKLPNVTVVSKGNAAKNTYTKTVIVDLTGKQAAAASGLAKELNGEVGSLPQGESKPANADFLVILGR